MSAHEKSRYKYHHAKAHAIQMAASAPANKQGIYRPNKLIDFLGIFYFPFSWYVFWPVISVH